MTSAGEPRFSADPAFVDATHLEREHRGICRPAETWCGIQVHQGSGIRVTRDRDQTTCEVCLSLSEEVAR